MCPDKLALETTDFNHQVREESGSHPSWRFDYPIISRDEYLPLRLEPCLLHTVSTEDKYRLKQWMNLPHVATFWQQAWSQERIDAYLMQQIQSYHDVYFIYAHDVPVAYTELYPIADDPLSQHCQHALDDWGWHLLIGPESLIGTGLAKAIGHCIVQYLFEKTLASKVFCEPDYQNTRMIKLVGRLHHHSRGRVTLSNKTAELMVCNRHDFHKSQIPEIPLSAMTALEKLSMVKSIQGVIS